MKLYDLSIPHKVLETVPVIEVELVDGRISEVRANARLKQLISTHDEPRPDFEIHIDDLSELAHELGVLNRYPGQTSLVQKFRMRAGDRNWRTLRSEFVLHRIGPKNRLAVGVVSDEGPMRRMEVRLAKVAASTRLLIDVGSTLSDSGRNLEEALSDVARLVSLHFNVVCDISLKSSNGQIIEPKAVSHPNPDVVRAVRNLFESKTLKVGEGMVGQVMLTGKRFLMNNVSNLMQRVPDGLDPIIIPNSILYLPLNGRDLTMGSLNLSRLEPLPFTDQETAEAQEIANLVTIFLERNRAYAQLSEELVAKETAQKRASLSEQRQRTILQNVEDVIMTLSLNGDIIFLNHNAKGFEGPQYVGQNLYNLMPPDMAAERRGKLQETLITGQPFVQVRQTIDLRGEEKWFQSSYYPYGEDGDLERFIVIIRDITEQYLSDLKVLDAVVRAQEQERARLSADLHDGVGQVLTSIALELSRLTEYCTVVGGPSDRVKGISTKVMQAVSEVRAVSHGLRPLVLESFGLSTAMADLCRQMSSASGLNIQFDAADVPDSLAKETEAHIFRIAQELLNNVQRHAQANNVQVNLIGDEAKLTLSVEDDGIGLPEAYNSKGIGLKNIEARVRLLRGDIEIEHNPESGTFFNITVPLTKFIT